MVGEIFLNGEMYFREQGFDNMEKKERIAFVVHRYGKGINGGAEDHCRLLVKHLSDLYAVDILTSCSKSFNPWDNYYEPGKTDIDGITVFRFYVEKSWETIGPFCPDFEKYIISNYMTYQAIIFITYNQYLSYIGAVQNFPNAILLPTAHDGESLRNNIFRKAFQGVKGFLYNSREERLLLESIYDINDKPFRTTCFGLDVQEYEVYPIEEEKKDYIIYAGRVSNSKNFMELNEFFLRYKKYNPSDLKLVVIGKIDNNMTITHHDDIIFKGFVSEDEKKKLIKNALLLVLPSKTESLSIVLLESFACARPVLVNGYCDVLKGQCERSNGGLYYMNYYEFESELNYLVENESVSSIMGQNGYEYVRRNYSWDWVKNNVVSLIHEIHSEKFYESNREEYNEVEDSPIDIKDIVNKCKKTVQVNHPKSAREKFIRRLIESALNYEQIVIVGAGTYGNALYKLLKGENIDSVVCFADNNYDKYQQYDKVKKVYSIEKAVALYPEAYYVVTPKYYLIDLWNQLNKLKISSKKIGYYIN